MDFPVLKKLTNYYKNSLKAAAALAVELRHKQIKPEHLLYGLITIRGSLSFDILTKNHLKPEKVKINVRNLNQPVFDRTIETDRVKFSSSAQKALEKSVLLANRYQHRYVGTEHLLFALLELGDPALGQIFQENRLSADEIKKQLTNVLKSTSKFPDLTSFFEKPENEEEEDYRPAKPSKTPALDFFANDLTDKDFQKTVDPVIGREKEIERLIQILSRRTKNNPLLVGDPGVGKTAIVEGLAKKISQGDVPEILKNKKIMALDLAMVVAGTIYRGEFESRLKQLIEEIKADPNIILFIDEIHNIMGTGSASGSMDAANILKPALSKGQIRNIGATTPEEYKKNIEADPALERRFQPIMVKESSPEETFTILKGVRENFEKYHRVRITDQAIGAAVALSSRFIQDKFLPDKAIDLIDEAAAKIKVKAKPSPLEKKIKEKEEEREQVKNEKEKYVLAEDFEKAFASREKEIALEKEICRLKESLAKSALKMIGQIEEKNIADVVSGITGIPLHELVKSEKEKLINMEKALQKFIIGQAEAVKDVSDFIRRSRVGLSSPNRPLGSFIFLGPSGVGKTELAKVLARVVFEDESALIRIDMSEFSESFNASKLIGAPAGYVGYKETTKLTDQVKRRPYSVVLFDEIEKAHSDVFNLLLQILEDGQLTDATGKKINFKNTIIIMTSNIGLENLNRIAALGFEAQEGKEKEMENKYEETREKILADLKKEFPPEFLNRIDKIIVFRPLSEKSIEKIVDLQIGELNERLKEKNLKVEIAREARKALAQKAFSPDQGARAVRRIIQEKVENPLAQKILEGKISESAKVAVKKNKENIILEDK